MPSLVQIKGLQKLLEKLHAAIQSVKRDDEGSVIVGYTAKYALYVHENIEMKWRGFPRDRSIRKGTDGIAYTGYKPAKKAGLFWGPDGQAKFLEQPARELSNSGELARIVRAVKATGAGIVKGLLMAGLRIQRASMMIVPVDLGNLRASAFTRLDDEPAQPQTPSPEATPIQAKAQPGPIAY